MKKILIFIGLKLSEIAGVILLIWLSSVITSKVHHLIYGMEIFENFFIRGIVGLLFTACVLVVVIGLIMGLHDIIVLNMRWTYKIANKVARK